MNLDPAARKAPSKSLYANRQRIYPMAVRGGVRRFKWAVLIVCLAVYYLLPWLRWDRGPNAQNQAVLLDLWNERFYFFGLEFWPQDIYLLTGLLVLGAVGLFLVTSLVGRAWCGYACPQTVWTDLFMLFERWIEGDHNQRMRRDAAPLSFDKAWRKVAKHAVWGGVAFWTGGAWIMYYVDAPTVTVEFWNGTASADVYIYTGLFTLTTYLLAGWAREQVCTFMCPWPRFQAAMMDEHSLIVTYQDWRGEPRGLGKRNGTKSGLGDCVDCMACVKVCPTGIDIRDGVQLECISCGLCIDACNNIMRRSGGKPWLITWDTFARQAAKKAGRAVPIGIFRPRTMIYTGALVLALSAIAVGVVMRSPVGLSVLHDRAPLFVRLSSGELRNAYTIKLSNKTRNPTVFELSVKGLNGASMILSEDTAEERPSLRLPVEADSMIGHRVLVQAPMPASESQPIDFILRDLTSGDQTTYHSVFLGPTVR